MTEKKYIEVTFKNVSDFRSRIARLWQEQKDNECYDFIFLDKETESEYEKLIKCFYKE